MRHFVSLFNNERGITLVELLLAIVISTLVLGIAYGLLLMGMKTYEKVGIEQGLRDEADYVVAQIMQTFYDGEISDIKNECQKLTSSPLPEPPESEKNICIEIHKTVASKISTSTDNTWGMASFNELKDSLLVKQIKIVKETIDGKDVNSLIIQDYIAEKKDNKITIKEALGAPKNLHSSKYDFVITPKGDHTAGSEINATCSYESKIITDSFETDPTKKKFINKKCTNGIVDISLLIKRANVYDDKYTLELKSQFGF